ncbi:hypothetical protein L2719_18810 [Shewanella schlegeliana]|uniref:Uncharacterized protein n=1 Tax=Shewanella schlegeliana TaxID=190308 RepID=A0ABS1T0B6_9GAMM|nr:hypothetical protein [Shewanella schlegeliana]MBL4913700.1 hypothetical protein [Shewanella schlegeliana]MCL1111583.1 hypothetical protein [Shewanella schlegeliana]GIU36843.1 hypothetical protein TUM4433_36230 [Shewanella schlegeliana]
MTRIFSSSFIHIIIALIMIMGLLTSTTSHAMTIEGKKISVSANDATLYVSAYMAPVLCANGGVKFTAVGEFAVDIVSLYCLNDAQVDKLIEGLQEAKSESARLKALSN